MAFVDELELYARAGHGGNGVERWLHERGKEFGGPAGGDGGNGGDVYVRGVRDINALSKLTHEKKFVAEAGEHGKSKNMYGKNGEDLFIPVPMGSVVTNHETGETFEVLEDGQEVKILSGGRGGLGNTRFKGSTNVRPIETTPGKPGQEATFKIELQIIADAGFVGFPNAGKSSLLNALTRAEVKVASYAFTTLDPNLGSFYGFILADIPGLIEGASEGKGLGHKFLRHIARTRLLIHCISLERDDLLGAYKTIRKELEPLEGLSQKDEMVVFTKEDCVTPEELKEKKKAFEEATGKNPISVTLYDDDSIKTFSDQLTSLLSKQP